MSNISVTELLECGVHFGHRASRWNPKMKPFIHGKRNTIHMIDLKETVKGLVRSSHFLKETSSEGGKILFVGTKRSAKEAIKAIAQKVGQPYVAERWLGGTLTNFRTIRSRLDRLKVDDMDANGTVAALSKSFQARHLTEKTKILKNLEGMRALEQLPACLVVVDPGHEHIAVAEANKTGIPVIALLDTDCDPDLVDIAIPGNDDAMRSVSLILARIGDAVEAGAKAWQLKAAELEKVEADRRKVEEAKKMEMDRRRQVEADWQKKLRAEAEVRRARASTEAALQALEQQAGSREEGVTRPIEDEPDDKTAVAQGDVPVSDAPTAEEAAAPAGAAAKDAKKKSAKGAKKPDAAAAKPDATKPEAPKSDDTKGFGIVSTKEISAALVMKLRQVSGLPMMKCKEALEATEGDFDKAVEWLRKKGLDMAAKKADRTMKEGRVAIKTSPDAKTAAMVEVDCETEPVAGGPDFKALVDGVLAAVFTAKAKGATGELLLADVLSLPLAKPAGATVDVAVKGLVAKIGENMGVRRAAAVDTTGRVGTYLHFNGKVGVLSELEGPAAAVASSDATAFLTDLGMHVAFAKPAAVSRADIPKELVEKELEIYREQAKQDPKMAGKPAPMVEKILLGKLDKFYAEKCLLEQPWVKDDKQSVKQVLEATSKKAGGPLSIKRSVLFQVGA